MPVLVGRTASAEVQADAVLGVVGAGVRPQLGARAGLANESLGALVSADWTYIGEGNAEDLDEYRDRFRALAHGVLPFELTTDAALAVRLGAGLELARLTSQGSFPPRYPHPIMHDSDLGTTFEGAVGVFYDTGPFAIGGELGIAISLHEPSDVTKFDGNDGSQRTDVFIRLVGRFATSR